jgi:predicted DNA-binding transcriptional regulator AlpA
MEQEFVQPAEVTEITGLSIAALAQLRYQGRGPRFYKPTPRTVLYKRAEVIAWVEDSAQTSTNRSHSFA